MGTFTCILYQPSNGRNNILHHVCWSGRNPEAYPGTQGCCGHHCCQLWRHPHQDHPGQLHHGAVRLTHPLPHGQGSQHGARHWPLQRPQVSPHQVPQERDHVCPGSRISSDSNSARWTKLRMSKRDDAPFIICCT